MSRYNQMCVWPGTIVGEKVDDFKKLMLEKFDTRVEYVEEILTGPDLDGDGKPVPETGGRNDLFFKVHDNDIGKFALARLPYGIRWIEDVLAPVNYNSPLYPERVRAYCRWEALEGAPDMTLEEVAYPSRRIR